MKSESIEVNGARYNLKIYYEIRNDTTASIRNNNINIKIPIFIFVIPSPEIFFV